LNVPDPIYAATRKGVFTIEKAGASWHIGRVSFLGDNASIVLPTRDGWVFTALGHGHFGVKMHRSTDGGRTWTECAAPAYPPKPDNAPEVVDPVSQRPVRWNLELVWSLERGGNAGAGVLWAGTIPGGLFRSQDNGDTWDLIRPLWDNPRRARWFGGGAELPGIHSICVDPRDPQRVAVAVSCGGVWLTEDGGETWDTRGKGMRAAYVPPELAFEPDIQDPHQMVQCPGHPDAYWVQHHNGIFRSRDALGSWQEVENARPSSFGFGVAVHPRDPNTAWFVPGVSDMLRVPVDGRLVVSRTQDGGRTFEVLTRGLPQEHAYEIAYRHALDVDAAGNTLAFGTTTGSLYVSEDGGDSWQTVSHHLPPIHAVRFPR
jgi:photosystem II stability/assembly factor-like uncharacterized protein